MKLIATPLDPQIGATALEFIVIAPLFFFMLFCIVELGRYFVLISLAGEGAQAGLEYALKVRDIRIDNYTTSSDKLSDPSGHQRLERMRSARENVAARAFEFPGRFVSDTKSIQKIIRFVLPEFVSVNDTLSIVEHSPVVVGSDGNEYSGLAAAVIRPGESYYYTEPGSGQRMWLHHPDVCRKNAGVKDKQACSNPGLGRIERLDEQDMDDLLSRYPIVTELRIIYRPMFPLSLLFNKSFYAVGRAAGYIDKPQNSELIFPGRTSHESG